jgi:spermidine dehydrogenase
MSSAENNASDKALGMDQKICRRDFLNSALLGSGSALLGSLSPRELLARDDWTGYGGVGDYANSNGNTYEVMTAGHQIRNHVFNSLPADTIDTGEVFDCVIIGGGISGLATALFFKQYVGSQLNCLVLEDHPIFGGEAKRNEFIVDGQRLMGPQGSTHFSIPYPYSFIARFYESIGLDWREFNYQTWRGPSPELPLGTDFEDTQSPYGFYFGAKFGQKPGVWLIDPWKKKLAGAPIPASMRAELLRYQKERRKGVPFEYPGDAKSRRLDSMTIKQYLMETYGLGSETIETFMADAGGGFGAGPDVSAYCMYAFHELHPLNHRET